jgi:hypothetical protein
MFVSIDDKLYNKCVLNCEKYKFKKTTLHYTDSKKTQKKVKVVSINDKLFIYDPTKIISKLIIPKSKLLETICEMINSIIII